MSDIKVYLRGNYVNKNGESSIYLRLHVARRKVDLPTRVSVKENQWDPIACKIKKNHPDAEDYNLITVRRDQCIPPPISAMIP